MLRDLINIENASILLYGEDSGALSLLQSSLTQAGFNNLTVLCCPDLAASTLSQQPPDLLLMDLTVSGFNKVLEQLQQQFNNPAIPVVAVNETESRENKLHYLNNGIHDFLNHPVDVNEALCRIRNWLCVHLSHKESLDHYRCLDLLIEKRNDELKRTQQEILQRLGLASEYKDGETYQHTIRVGQYAGCIARSMGFSEGVVEELTIAAPLHDVGKIGVPDKILLKQGKLDERELDMMKMHTIHGYNILKGSNNPLLKSAEIIALSHHERWDGNGYPHQLRNTEIHLYGRITALCDVYDALTMQRPYKKAWTHEAAVELILNGRGTQFDPEIVDVFLSITQDFFDISKGECLIR